MIPDGAGAFPAYLVAFSPGRNEGKGPLLASRIPQERAYSAMAIAYIGGRA